MSLHFVEEKFGFFVSGSAVHLVSCMGGSVFSSWKMAFENDRSDATYASLCSLDDDSQTLN